MTPELLSSIQAELIDDPAGLGYAALMRGDDEVPEGAPAPEHFSPVVDALNAARDTINVQRDDVEVAEILQSIDVADFGALSTGAAAWLQAVSSLSSSRSAAKLKLVNDDGTDTRVLGNLKQIMSGAGSKDRIVAIASRKGSRAEELFGRGTVLTVEEVIRAWRLPGKAANAKG